MVLLCCNTCKKELKFYKILYLEDTNKFTNRELFVVRCNKCKSITVVLKETRISDKKVFIDKITSELLALRTIARESKRVIKEVISSDSSTLNGWIYGTNVEIKNRQGKVVQVRQYATDFGKKKELVKKIMVKNG